MTQDSPLLCELCGTAMTCQSPAASQVAYFHCAGCGRWVASCYGDELVRAGTARVPRGEQPQKVAPPEFERIKARLSRWLEAIDESDPFHILGVPPSASEETIRARFKELALQHHPDRGGDPAQMRRLLNAYERIRQGKRLDRADPVVSGHGRPQRPVDVHPGHVGHSTQVRAGVRAGARAARGR